MTLRRTVVPAQIPYRLLVALALLAALLIPDGALDHAPFTCPFRLLTGLPCPTCGLTRSWIALVHGNLSGSLSVHPLGPVTVVAAILFVMGVHARYPAVTALLRSRPLWAVCVFAWVAIWLVRLQTA
jgi:hypothetical protein